MQRNNTAYLLILLMGVLFIAPVYADSLGEQYSHTLSWDIPVNYNIEQHDNRTILQFSQPLPAKQVKQFIAQMQGNIWIENLLTGYDSLSIQTHPAFETQARRVSDTDIQLYFTSHSQTPSPLAYSLLDAQLDFAQGYRKRAIHSLECLEIQYPYAPEVYYTRANMEYEMARYYYTLDAVDSLISLSPHNETAHRLHQATLDTRSAYIDAGYQFVSEENEATQNIFTVQGDAQINDYHHIGASFQSNILSTSSPLTFSDGTIAQFSKAKYRGALFYTWYEPNANHSKYLLYTNGDSVGAGFNYYLWQYNGGTLFELDYHRPEWDSPTLIAQDATIDRAQITQDYIFNQQLYTQFIGAFNSYNLGNENSLTNSISGGGTLVYQFEQYSPMASWLGHGGGFSVNYDLDLEYPTKTTTRTASDGTSFNPTEIEKRQIHSLAAGITKDWLSGWQFAGLFGYSVDVHGTHAPLAVVDVNYTILPDLLLAFNASHTLATKSKAEVTNAIGVNLKWLV